MFDRYGMADAERIYNSALEVRCPECGRRTKGTVERSPGDKGLHSVWGTCSCGRVEIRGSVQVWFERKEATA